MQHASHLLHSSKGGGNTGQGVQPLEDENHRGHLLGVLRKERK